MTEDDKDKSTDDGNIHSKQPIKPRDILEYTNQVSPKKITMQTAFESGLTVKAMVWLRLPWLVSTTVMFVSIISYFAIHDWHQEAFTETILGIIIGGSATNAGITILNLHKNAN